MFSIVCISFLIDLKVFDRWLVSLVCNVFSGVFFSVDRNSLVVDRGCSRLWLVVCRKWVLEWLVFLVKVCVMVSLWFCFDRLVSVCFSLWVWICIFCLRVMVV